MTREERWKENRNYAYGKQDLETFKKYLMPENNLQSHLHPNDTRDQFVLVEKYCRGLGFDCGVGTNRFSQTVLSTDWYPHKDADLIWNCFPPTKEGEQQYFYPYPFREDRFDFVFASHVLEDFHPDHIQMMFDELLRMIKPGGYYVILGPCMDGVRYAKWDEVFTADSPEVIKGERQIGEKVGNPSHMYNWTLEFCHQLKEQSKYPTEIVQEDTFTHDRMTLDFILQKK